MNNISRKLIIIALLFIYSFPIFAQNQKNEPRFASLSSDLINLRTGPGMQYPIEWVYKKRDFPIEIIEDYDVWRKIKEIDGTQGWIHQSMLSSRRYGIIQEKTKLTRKQDINSQIVAYVEPNVVVKIISCSKNSLMCRVEVKGKHGFVPRNILWGIYLNENF